MANQGNHRQLRSCGFRHWPAILLLACGLFGSSALIANENESEPLPDFILRNAPPEFRNDGLPVMPEIPTPPEFTPEMFMNAESPPTMLPGLLPSLEATEGEAPDPVALSAEVPAIPTPDEMSRIFTQAQNSSSKIILTDYTKLSQHWQNSMMFSPEKIGQLQAVWDAYEQQRAFLASLPEDEQRERKQHDKGDFLSRILGDIKTPDGKNPREGSEASGTEAEYATPAVHNYYINSIVYYTPERWSVWINRQKFTPKKLPEHFMLESVEPERIVLRFDDNQALLEKARTSEKPYLTVLGASVYVTLQPAQSFLGASGEVIEGQFFTPSPLANSQDKSDPALNWNPAEKIENPRMNMDKDLANRAIGIYKQFQKMDPRQKEKSGQHDE